MMAPQDKRLDHSLDQETGPPSDIGAQATMNTRADAMRQRVEGVAGKHHPRTSGKQLQTERPCNHVHVLFERSR